MNGIYVFFIATYVVTLPFVHIIPKESPACRGNTHRRCGNTKRPSVRAWIGIAAIVIAYINIGAYWSNIELAAESSGLDGDWSAQVIAWSVLLSFFGCFGAMIVLKKFDYDRPLLVTLAIMVFSP